MGTLTATSNTKKTISGLKASLNATKQPANSRIACDILGEPSATDLAQLYCSAPESALHREDLLESARIQLSKYDLDEDELDRIVPVLARTLHMLIEQNGGKHLASKREIEIERQVLDWCGCQDPSYLEHG
jgi:hypothetical protein